MSDVDTDTDELMLIFLPSFSLIWFIAYVVKSNNTFDDNFFVSDKMSYNNDDRWVLLSSQNSDWLSTALYCTVRANWFVVEYLSEKCVHQNYFFVWALRQVSEYAPAAEVNLIFNN